MKKTIRDRYLDRKQIRTLFETAKLVDARIYPLLYLAYYSGARLGELLKLRWAWIDLEEGRVQIRNATTWSSKAREGRVFYIPEDALRWLREFKSTQSNAGPECEPSAALSIDEILDEADLAAIGLNDLTQYLMAADREDEAVQRYHDALQPAVLRLVRQVVAAGEARDKLVSVCGELAGDSALTAALLALGVRRLSVSRADYERITDLIERISISELERRREGLVRARTGSEVRRILGELRP